MKLDLQLYRGYLNDQELVVSGHVFKSWAPDKYSIDKKGVKHAFSILHMFTISPLENIDITLEFQDKTIQTKTLEDGFFRFTVPFSEILESGWHPYKITCALGEIGIVETSEVLKPFDSKYGIISDIDDTFLISHSSNIFKKLYVMLSKNVNKRKVFTDVVDHYQALSIAGQDSDEASNSFFYVSSSEWNLYAFIDEFARLHRLPKAVIKLKSIKTKLTDFLKSGRGDHDHKFQKIKDIISFYPNLTYVLLGDDSQQDPFLYEHICKIFPENIRAVYIRQTSKKQKGKVQEVLTNIETLSVKTLYFKDSHRAIEHSKEIDIIQ